MGPISGITVESEDTEEHLLRSALGKRLRQCRKERGMPMVRLGQIAHCSQSFISKLESGALCPSIPMLNRLARALDVRPSYLIMENVQSLGDQTSTRLVVNELEP
jgi:transcriptional regulator with XRE-family HTH domain